ncbi:LysR family transcriptional regulator [Paenarthrobacter nitroguajacolicus]|uniref:LysR family transcriptional regulator n=1 Tax=Paenarthrobacter nitroguajacolicus TaxID=211146 RepID=UPI0015B9EB65|nr:LysR family transcriptional regulator [Paenarthrobacter nitroguajacolicus]NWL32715.1 LysR family transcriptional regulator [Paenarthrobacter nitroguajacolicus]
MVNLLTADLNLLVALDALLVERNVTRAGARIGISQPAMSSSLQRLRRQFDDELLTRVGSSYELTPLAQVLKEDVAQILRMVERTFDAQAVFDPALSSRSFRIVTSDYCLTAISGKLMAMLQEEAPGVQVHFDAVTPQAVERIKETLQSADLMLIPKGHFSGFPHTELFTDNWVCVTGASSPERTLTVEEMRDARWARLFGAEVDSTLADRRVYDLQLGEKTDIIVDSFLMLPFAVTGTARLALVQERLARMLASVAGVRIMQLPISLPTLVECAWWHPSKTADPGHQWFRRLVARAAAQLDTEAIDSPVTPPSEKPEAERSSEPQTAQHVLA